MHPDHMQGERKPQMGRAPVPWGRALNDELSPVIGKYGELVGNLQKKYGTANTDANRRVDEFKNIIEQLRTIGGEHMILQKAVSKANLPKTGLESETVVTKNPDKSEDLRLVARMRSKALSLLYRAKEALVMSDSGRLLNVRNESHETKRHAKRSFSMNQMGQVFYDWVRKLVPIGQSSNTSTWRSQMSESGQPQTASADAEFLGWQKTTTGEDIALYNVTAKQHPLYHSTVSEKTLRREQLQIPPTPLPQEEARRPDHEE